MPSVVKKGATGKGNADKDMMYEAFLKETKIDLKKIFDTDKVVILYQILLIVIM